MSRHADELEDARRLDAVVHALGIEDSFVEPADAVKHLHDELEKTRRERDDLRDILAGIGKQAASVAKSYSAK